MPTDAISTIRASGMGGDYLSVSAWLTAENAIGSNLVSRDVRIIAECYNDWPGGLNNAFAISGWTTDATRNIVVRPASGHRHNGYDVTTGFYIRETTTANPKVLLAQNYCTVEGIGVYVDAPYAGARTPFQINNGGPGRVIDGCIATDPDSLNSYYSFIANYIGSGSNSHTELRFRNCLAINTNSSAFRTEIQATVENCAAINTPGTGFSESNSSSRSMIAKNCLAYNCGTSYSLSGVTGTTNNAASNGATVTPPGTSPYTSDVVSGDFVDAANDDFHLSSGSGLRGQGDNLYSSFTKDIDGDTWPSSGAWDIGVDYYVAAGGSTIEAGLTISTFSGITPVKNAVFEPELITSTFSGMTSIKNAVFEPEVTISSTLSANSLLANSILNTAISLNSTLLSEYSYTASLEAAISFISSLSIVQDSIATYEANSVYGVIHNDEYQSQVDFLVQILFAKTVASLFTTGLVVEADMLFGISQDILNSVTAVIEAATVYSTSQGMDHGNNALLNAIQNIDISQGIDFNSIASLQSSITFGVVEETGIDGAIGTSQIDANLSMGLIQSYLTSTGSNVWEPDINVGLLQSIDAITVANLFATTTLGSQLVFTTNSGNSIESAIDYAIHHSNIYEVDISIEGNINLGISQVLENSVQADINGTVLLTHQIGLQTIVQAIMNAGLALTSISNIAVNGSVLSLEVILPCGRTLLVSIENRTLQIQADNRTVSINGCN